MALLARHETLGFTPSQDGATAAECDLRLRRKHHRGDTAIDVAQAQSVRVPLRAAERIRRMSAYLSRQQVNQRARGWADRRDPSAGHIIWLLRGGDVDRRRTDALLRRMRSLDQEA